MELLLIVAVIGAVVFLVMKSQNKNKGHSANQLEDAKADARQSIERLGGQVYNLVGSDDASKQALADASERYTAAGSQIEQATTPVQARLAKQTALEGLYYIRAARSAMGMDPGPEIPSIDGQKSAGSVTEDRDIEFEGRQVSASPNPSARTPNYYPGGRVAGRPVPAGWYSEPWWKPALVAGAWGVGSMFLFSAMFSGMSGVGYDAQGFADGYQDGMDAADGDGGDAGTDGGDGGDAGGDVDYGAAGDGGGDYGGDWGGGDFGGGDFGGGDFGGGDFGGFDF
ncbi:GA module-containing protein [Rhodococcus sp. W8901]|uniref:GA module-containing protein n=1 Tax=Rhodococcus sp. W8901 TaxID=2742603 RepID=UPI00158154BC|nr:GA module-containing protein [Rhodococcus sp. W8901]QKT12265.1 GA module-containing protein [Rhodococcus sp. W8901]